MLQDVIIKARELHYRGAAKREAGAHASGGGWCYKKAILETMVPEASEEFDTETLEVFDIGHKGHKIMDERLCHYSQETAEFLWIQPFRLFTMSNIIKEGFIETASEELIKQCPIPLGVFGTPDGIILDVKAKGIIIPDFKTTNGKAFSYKLKGSRSYTHEVQLGTYLPGILGMLKHIGCDWEVQESSLIYIRKDDNALCTHNYDPALAMEAARTYWKNFGRELGNYIKSGGTQMPTVEIASGANKWMCNYCSMFKSKTECNSVTDIGQFLDLKDLS
jgi:hypothetical protein